VKKHNPFDEIKEELLKRYTDWVLRSFAGGPTFRMFHDFSKVRGFLEKHGSALTDAKSQKEHDRVILHLARMFRRSSSGIMASGKKPSRPTFGYAVKVLNLYVKHYGFSMPYFSGKAEAHRAKQLVFRAHVPLDRIVLEWIWKDFGSQLQSIQGLNGLRRIPRVNSLTESQYCAIQQLLRDEANEAGLPPIAYDFKWTRKPN
jgi:hypothetical protein